MWVIACTCKHGENCKSDKNGRNILVTAPILYAVLRISLSWIWFKLIRNLYVLGDSARTYTYFTYFDEFIPLIMVVQ